MEEKKKNVPCKGRSPLTEPKPLCSLEKYPREIPPTCPSTLQNRNNLPRLTTTRVDVIHAQPPLNLKRRYPSVSFDNVHCLRHEQNIEKHTMHTSTSNSLSFRRWETDRGWSFAGRHIVSQEIKRSISSRSSTPRSVKQTGRRHNNANNQHAAAGEA